MDASKTIRALDDLAARLTTGRCVEPQLADHVRSQLEAQRRGHELALLPRGDRIRVVDAIRNLERVLDGAVGAAR